MVFFAVALICILLVSVALCVFAIRRLYAYIYAYRFDESVYTLLFGFIRLRYFVFLYGFSTALSILWGLFYLYSFYEAST